MKNNLKRLLSVALAIIMVMSVMPVAFAAEGNVAAIGGTAYESLQAAINACVTGDNEITLLADCDETVTIKQSEGINIVLDGKNKTYSGTIKVDGNNRPAGSETLTIKNFKFDATATNYAYFIDATKNAAGGNSESHNVTVDSCTFKSNNWHYAIATRHPYNLVVKNCTAENVYYLLYNPQGGQKITVEGCTVTGATYGIGSQKCLETYVKNYTYSGKAAGIYGRSSSNASVITMENVDITTTYAKQSALTLWKNNDKTTSKTFTFVLRGDNNKFTAPEGVEWFACQSSTNSPYEFVEQDIVAKIGEETYVSIKEAVEAAKDGDTITVVADHAIDCSELDSSVYGKVILNIDKDITLDLNGKKITANPDISEMLIALLYVEDGNKVTLKDSTEAQDGEMKLIAGNTPVYSMFMAEGATSELRIESGRYIVDVVDKGQSMFYAEREDTIAITGGYFELGNADKKTHNNGEKYPWIFNTEGDGKYSCYVIGGTYNVDPTHYHGETGYPVCYTAVENEDGTWTVTLVHTPGAAATCKASQICTVCETELDAIKDHVFSDYVSNGDATCKANGTKTAKCIYDCGLTDTVVDEGSKKVHTDADNNDYCDYCNSEFCEFCGKVHNDWMSNLFCLIVEFIELINSFVKSIF